jgi:sugar phosphate permease
MASSKNTPRSGNRNRVYPERSEKPMESATESTLHDRHRRVVFLIICFVYFLVYFHRVSTSVIAKDLLRTFQTNATALGFMSSMYFYLYALEQPLVGYLADRIGPRRVIAYWTMAAALGCFLFGLSPSIGWATAGRALIGIGVGGVYVPALKAVSLWFKQKEFSAMVGLLMSVGNLGAVIATTPLAWAAGTWGWRPTFFLIGGITFLLAFITLFLTRDHKDTGTGHKTISTGVSTNTGSTISNLIHVLTSGQFWIICVIFFGIYGTLITLQGLWATPFLMTALGIEALLASKLNMLIPVGVIIGSPLLGWVSDRFAMDKRRILIGILAVYTLTWVGLIFGYSPLGTLGIGILQFVMGMMAGGFISILWGIVRETTPSGKVGLISGLLNPAPFFGVAVFQVISGAILDRAGKVGDLYPIEGFRNAFMVCLIANLLCLALAFCIRKPKEQSIPLKG